LDAERPGRKRYPRLSPGKNRPARLITLPAGGHVQGDHMIIIHAGGGRQENHMSTLTESVDLQAPPSPLIFTDSAVEKVRELLIEEGSPELKLRVFVQGGGCSGFQYGFTFDELVND